MPLVRVKIIENKALKRRSGWNTSPTRIYCEYQWGKARRSFDDKILHLEFWCCHKQLILISNDNFTIQRALLPMTRKAHKLPLETSQFPVTTTELNVKTWSPNFRFSLLK